MAKARTAPSVLLTVALLGADEDLMRRARQLLVRRYGALADELAPFDSADGTLYEHQMGAHLRRCFLLFARPLRPGRLADVKIETNALEVQITEDSLLSDYVRALNIDPSYVTPHKLVRATTHDTPTSVYLDGGVYGEVLLVHSAIGWEALPHAPADYATPASCALWNHAGKLAERAVADAAADASEPQDP